MDIEFIKEKIYHTDVERKIQPGEYLSAEVINILRDGNTTDRIACFAPGGSPKEPCLFECEINCSKCSEPIIRTISKTTLFDYLKKSKSILCDGCMNECLKQQEENKIQYKVELKEREEKIIKITDDYISAYLDPNQEWDKSIPLHARKDLIVNRNDINYNIITKHIKSMSYKDFLQTPYWEAISAYKKYKENYRCALCGSNKNLATHHKTYERHGEEHTYKVINEDLIVLCKDCHSKFHNKL